MMKGRPIKVTDKIFGSFQLSKAMLLNELALLLAKQQFAEYSMTVEYFEKKYNKDFNLFDTEFKTKSCSYETENDWMSWKFAVESKNYWTELISQVKI